MYHHYRDRFTLTLILALSIINLYFIKISHTVSGGARAARGARGAPRGRRLALSAPQKNRYAVFSLIT